MSLDESEAQPARTPRWVKLFGLFLLLLLLVGVVLLLSGHSPGPHGP